MKPSAPLATALSAVAVLGGVLSVTAAQSPTPVLRQVPYLDVPASLKTIELPDGYRLEPVVTEPIVKEPVAIAFDGNGRMFVAEMRTYMQDLDGTAQHEPKGRVSLHWSSKGDSNFDRHTVFADHLVLPRMLLPLRDGVLINETDTEDLYLYRDTNGDGVSDEKTLFFRGGKRGGNLEHQQSGLLWSLDNWIYQAVNAYRLRIDGTNVLKEPTAPNGGQWGIGQDNAGKPWFVNAGGEIGPLNFQVPIAYLDFRHDEDFAPGFSEVFPLVGLADVEGGPNRFRPADKTLNRFTATCGIEVFRGDRLPEELRGDLFFGEPVGRLVRRAKIRVREGLTQLENAHPGGEFLRSTDPNFRPVNMATAPDGTLYLVDMYRGIIQEGNWTRPGSFLRPRIEENGLQNNFGRGRIWRLAHRDFKPGPQPRMLDESPTELVAHLAHPNGWWRDTAQRLLVLRQDRSVAPALGNIVRSHPNPLARVHALWTLEGLGALTPDQVRMAFRDTSPEVRLAGIRASERLFRAGDSSLRPDVLALLKDTDASVVMQAMLTAQFLKWDGAAEQIAATAAATDLAGPQAVARRLLTPQGGGQPRSEVELAQLRRGRAIYQELCFTCHGDNGRGMALAGAAPGTTIAPPLAGSATVNGPREGLVNVMLKGLAGPVAGKTYDAQMVPMESNDDAWIADVSSYVRNAFGNRGALVSSKLVAKQRAALAGRTEPWTLEELAAALPRPVGDRARWKVSASHHGDSAKFAIDGQGDTRFDTATSQRPGMWFQVELPAPTRISGVELDASGSSRDYPRGFQVLVSDDGKTWTAPVAEGKGRDAVTEIEFAPVDTRFVRLVQTGAVDGLYWSIHELNLLQPPAPMAAVKRPTPTATPTYE